MKSLQTEHLYISKQDAPKSIAVIFSRGSRQVISRRISKVCLNLCLNMSDIPLQRLNGSGLLKNAIAASQSPLEAPTSFACAQSRYEKHGTGA